MRRGGPMSDLAHAFLGCKPPETARSIARRSIRCSTISRRQSVPQRMRQPTAEMSALDRCLKIALGDLARTSSSSPRSAARPASGEFPSGAISEEDESAKKSMTAPAPSER